MKYNNYLVSVSRNSKVINLYYSEDLSDLNAIKAMHRDCDVDVFRLRNKPMVRPPKEEKTETFISRNGKPFANRVKCIENDIVYSSVAEVSKRLNIPTWAIYHAIRRNIAAYGYHFVFVPQIKLK